MKTSNSESIKSCPNSIILFEPICRGSRLQILANIVSAIFKSSQKKIVIVTRSDYKSSHLTELLGSFDDRIEYVTGDTNLDNTWIKILNKYEVSAMISALYRAIESNKTADIVFMALDEYMKPLLPHLESIRIITKSNRVLIIKYRVEYLINNQYKTWRNIIMNLITRWTLIRLRAQLVCFDERFKSSTIAGKPVATLPDPWFGEFTPLRRNDARKKHGFLEDDFVILTIGRQDRRKGFPAIIEIIQNLFRNKNKLFVVGKIDPEYIDSFNTLKNMLHSNILHIERFIDESELPDVFASADVFLLPYSLDFTSSSGTLPRAAASGVPVVTGSHGLVGHRVNSLGLGEVFDITDARGLLQSIMSIHNYEPAKTSSVRKALADFASSSSIKVFEKSVGNLLCNRVES